MVEACHCPEEGLGVTDDGVEAVCEVFIDASLEGSWCVLRMLVFLLPLPGLLRRYEEGFIQGEVFRVFMCYILSLAGGVCCLGALSVCRSGLDLLGGSWSG